MSLFSLNGINEIYESDEDSYHSCNKNSVKEDLFHGNKATQGNNVESENTKINTCMEKVNKPLPCVLKMFAETVPSIGIDQNKEIKLAKTHYSKEPMLYKTSKSQLSKTSDDMPQKSEHFGLPDAGTWHVPMTFVNLVAAKKKQYKEEETHAKKEKRKIEDEASFVRNRWKKNSNDTLKINRKAKEKEKRLKGQSSHDTWKPEAWIKLRQEFD